MTHVRGGVLLHPVALVALVALVVNDHVLKWRYPGLLTGKASDIAGLVLAPLVLLALVEWWGRPVPTPVPGTGALGAALVVGMGFSVVKAWPAAAQAYSSLLGLLVRPDPTDLWCLPALAIPVVVATRRTTRLKLVTPIAHPGPVQ